MTEPILIIEEDGKQIPFYVVEETRLGGMTYLLVADSPEGEAEARILKDVSSEEDAEACFVEVKDEDELSAVSGIFSEILEDVEIQ